MEMEISARRKKKRYNPLPLISLLVIVGVSIFFIIQTKSKKENDTPPVQDIDIEEEGIEEEVTPAGPHYEELLPEIGGQQAYIVVPTKIDKKNPPTVILYSHGSNTQVTQNMEEPFMKDLQMYGVLFTQHNYIFAASNQHGVNWGNTASIQDTLNLKVWIEENYSVKDRVHLLGFSMGGLPTMNFATTYPEIIEKIALLAPTTKSSDWNQSRADTLKDMDLKLWHGNKDVNVPYSYSASFVKKMSGYGVYIEFVTLEDKGHFDIDTEYAEDILHFFNS